jgi:hypothetical protein
MKNLVILRQLGIAVDESNANEKGEIIVSALYRNDRNPSLSININEGVWFDHGTSEGGNIYDLVMKTLDVDFTEAKAFVDGKGTKKSFQPKQAKYDVNLQGSFWTEDRKKALTSSQSHLDDATDSKILDDLKSYDGISRETLNHFNCGLINWDFAGIPRESILIPYPSGAQIYSRDDSGKLIRMFSGSKPAESFFGAGKLEGNKELLICKSPREAMLAFQELGTIFDVLGICSGETDKLSEQQIALLKDKAHNWKRVFVCFDRNTVQAEEIAFGFARKVCDAVGSFKRDVRLLNIGKLTNNECKDLTDLCKSSQKAKVSELFSEDSFEFSEYIWNIITHNNRFWFIDAKGKPVIDEDSFAKMLDRHGIVKSYLNEADEPTLIRDVDNKLSTISTSQLSDYVLVDILKKLSRYVDVRQTEEGEELVTLTSLRKSFFSYREKVLNKNIKAIIPPTNMDMLRDTAGECFLYYENGVIKVSASDMEILPFKDMPGKLWKSQIAERKFDLICPDEKGEFERFIELIAAEDPKRIKSFMSGLGYMAHSYKDRSQSPAIILIDEDSRPGFANGRTGKSLYAQSLKHVRQFNFTPGKTVDTKSRFFFQSVKTGDQVLYFDDVREEFDFTSLFNVITDDMEMERKYKDPTKIPFEESPKLAISTNSLIAGVGSSFKHRKFTLEFCSYFSASYTPVDEFGHKLFEDWSREEWLRFDHFIIKCIQLFLTEGLIDFPDSTVEVKALIADTSPDFYDWATAHLESDVTYKGNILFNSKNKMLDANNPPREQPIDNNGNSFPCFADVSNDLLDEQYSTFINWLKRYASYKDWYYNEVKSYGYKKVTFKERKINS